MATRLKTVLILCLVTLFIATGISLAVDRAGEIKEKSLAPPNKELKPKADLAALRASLEPPPANTKPGESASAADAVKSREPEPLFIDP